MTEKRFDIQFDGVKYFCVVDVPNERGVGRFDTIGDAKGYLELYEYYIDVEEELQKMKKENEQLEQEVRNYIKALNKTLEEKEELWKEDEQLKQQLDDLRTYNKEEFIETKQINNIYKEKGFKGVIGYAKDQLQQYGVVKEVEKGLWVMVTGGWSDNEHWIHCLNNPISMFCMKHYCGYLRGGAFYYTENPRGDVEIRLKGDTE